jgi:hypothetical protein
MEFLFLLCAIAVIFFAVVTVNKNEIDFYQNQTGGLNLGSPVNTVNNAVNTGTNAGSNTYNTITSIGNTTYDSTTGVLTGDESKAIQSAKNAVQTAVRSADWEYRDIIRNTGNRITKAIAAVAKDNIDNELRKEREKCDRECDREFNTFEYNEKRECEGSCDDVITGAVAEALHNGKDLFYNQGDCVDSLKPYRNLNPCFLVPPSMPDPLDWPSAPSAPSYNSPSSLSAIKTYNVNNTIPLKKYKSVSLNNFGSCENEVCTKYETEQKTCGQECVKYRTVCRGVRDWRGRSRKAICHKECVKTEPKMCDTQRCVERKCTKRKSINELNGMEIPQIHERIEKMKNIVNVYEQNSKIVMENFEKSTKDRVHRCFGTDSGFNNWKKWGLSGTSWGKVNAGAYEHLAWPEGTFNDVKWKC